MDQLTLFEPKTQYIEIEKLILYALGDFQSRGKVLAGRELALDRLRGAFRRSAEFFECDDPSDEAIAGILGELGVKVVKVPNFVAKHPFRVTVQVELAERAVGFFQKESK